MTADDLMAPRWKCIANFPGNTFFVGEVFEIPLNCKLQQIVLQGDNYKTVDLDINPDLYPAIFKKLEWWEDRKLEEYLKEIRRILKTKQWLNTMRFILYIVKQLR